MDHFVQSNRHIKQGCSTDIRLGCFFLDLIDEADVGMFMSTCLKRIFDFEVMTFNLTEFLVQPELGLFVKRLNQ